MQFSVIIPTCHRNADLAACLRLLAPGAQSLPAADYEVIVSDDGRTSTAEAMVKQQFPWARWVPGPQRGPASNRNCGARSAGGKWLVFTDDDCLPSRDWLAAYAAAATDEARVLEGKTVACGFRDRLDMECPVNETGG
jgi:glycosyltransferase involved in cell wall biosynthesis